MAPADEPGCGRADRRCVAAQRGVSREPLERVRAEERRRERREQKESARQLARYPRAVPDQDQHAPARSQRERPRWTWTSSPSKGDSAWARAKGYGEDRERRQQQRPPPGSCARCPRAGIAPAAAQPPAGTPRRPGPSPRRAAASGLAASAHDSSAARARPPRARPTPVPIMGATVRPHQREERQQNQEAPASPGNMRRDHDRGGRQEPPAACTRSVRRPPRGPPCPRWRRSRSGRA